MRLGTNVMGLSEQEKQREITRPEVIKLSWKIALDMAVGIQDKLGSIVGELEKVNE